MTPDNVQFTTGRLYWQAPTEDSWIDFGNTLKYQRAPKYENVVHKNNQLGVSQVDFSQRRQVQVLWHFTFDEQFGELMFLLFLATGRQTVNSGGVTNAAVVLTSASLIIGRTAFLGGGGAIAYLGLTAWSATDGITPLVEGTHYMIDRVTGGVTVLSIPNPGSDWTFTVSSLAKSIEVLANALGNLLATGTFRVVETDQQSFVPFNIEEFKGQVYVTVWGDNDMQKFSEYEVEVLHNPNA